MCQGKIHNLVRYLLLTIFIFTSGCTRKQGVVNIQLNWKSKDPQTIPFAIREREVQKGNLVVNPSFETGRFFSIDSARTSYGINGWTRVGENVFWTDIRQVEIYQKNEASDGFHAIKIVRMKADETDIQGEGVMSDYIRVIPGNYRLTCEIRLENVESGMKRLSANLLDAVNIRLFYYDKNKILIKSSEYNPAGDNIIDNSFKAYSFSGFDYVRELEWTRINCISNHFPFEEGDIPSEARFVKVFIGLKGTGTMWVDVVDFRYTSANFSLLEKCESFFDNDLQPHELLVPSPVSVQKYKKIELMEETPEKQLYPIILVPRDFRENDFKSLTALRGALEAIIPLKGKRRIEEIDIVTRLEPGMIESGRLIFSVGQTNIFNENAELLSLQELNGHSQGYLIKNPEYLNNLIFVYSESQEGYFYAFNTIKSLIDTGNKLYHHYDIVDYPVFRNRSFIFRAETEKSFIPEKELTDFLSIRLNNIYIQPSSEIITFRSLPTFYNSHKQYLSALWSRFPHFRYGFSATDILITDNEINKPDLKRITANVEESARSLAEIINKINALEENGIIISDRSLWDYLNLGSPAVSLKMLNINDYNLFIDLNKKFFEHLHISVRNNSDKIFFLPVFNDNSLLHKAGIYGRYYFKDYYFNDHEPDVLLWSGPAEYSFSIDGAELLRFQNETLKKNVWLDNTLTINKKNLIGRSNASIYPGKAKLGSFFEPFNVVFNLEASALFNEECIINLSDFSALSQIRLSTAADFLWNPNDYDPDFSLWKILVNRFGKDGAIELIRFSDTCYKLLYISMSAENEGLSPKLSREGEDIIRIINENWDSLTQLLSKDSKLLNQLTDKKNQIITRFYQTKRRRGGASSEM